jgi:beta-fructofuranosidase
MPASRRKFLKALGASGVLASFPDSDFFCPYTPDIPDGTLQARLAVDPLRPQFHLLPARNWMNDPDGPIFWKDHYHMFFQYNPNAAVWGDMHWWHAMSPDMIHWKHMPLGLAPTPGAYDQDGCFSGSAVNDDGTATFLYTGVKSVVPEEATLRDGKNNFLEVQCLATSRDPQLRSWDKFPRPVLLPPHDPKLMGFRDPCLWRDGKIWYMGIGSGQRGEGGRVLLYRSPNLRHWEYLHPLATGTRNGKELVNPVDSGEMWECPDFFALGNKHVLLYSTEGKVFWQTGEFDRKELVFISEKSGLLDFGAFYAPKSQLDRKGHRILWGWIPETRPEEEFSAAGWAGCMSLPRVLSLDRNNELAMRVIPEVAELRGREIAFPGRESSASEWSAGLGKIMLSNASAEIELRVPTKPVRLTLTDGQNQLLAVSYDPGRVGQELQMGTRIASLPSGGSSEHEMHIFWDGSVVECIADDKVSLTTRFYVAPKGNIRIDVGDSKMDVIHTLRIWPIQAISTDRLTT